MLLLLSFVSSSLLLPAGRCVRLPASSKIARSTASRMRKSSPNGPARPVAVNDGSVTQVWLASPKVATRAGKVEALLESGVSVEAANGSSFTPLEDAVYMGNVELVTALLEAGASLEAEDADETPLKTAIFLENSAVVKALLEAGASLEAQDANAVTPLDAAIRQGNVEVVETLIDAGASLEAQDANAVTPLDAAIRQGNVEVVETLIEAGASLDRRDWRVTRFLFTPLEYAIFGWHERNLNVIKVLIYASLTANPPGFAIWLTFWLANLSLNLSWLTALPSRLLSQTTYPVSVAAGVAIGLIACSAGDSVGKYCRASGDCSIYW